MLYETPSCLDTIYTVTSWLTLGHNFSTWSPGVATPGALNDPGNVWGPLVQPNPTCPDFHLYCGYPSVCLFSWAKSEAAKRKVGPIAEISDVSSSWPLWCHLCPQTSAKSNSCEKKETFSNYPFECHCHYWKCQWNIYLKSILNQ